VPPPLARFALKQIPGRARPRHSVFAKCTPALGTYEGASRATQNSCSRKHEHRQAKRSVTQTGSRDRADYEVKEEDKHPAEDEKTFEQPVSGTDRVPKLGIQAG